MKKIKRVSALLAVLLLVCGMLGGCAKKPITTDAVVMTINGHDVTMQEYRYYYLSLKQSYDNGVSSYWNNNSDGRTELKNAVQSYLLQNAACDEMLAQNGYTLSEADTAEVDAYLNDIKSYYGSEDTYREALADNNLTEEMYRASLERSQLVYRYLYDINMENNTELMKTTLEKYVRVKHVLVLITDPTASSSASSATTTPHTDAEALEIAQDVEKQAKNGADFDTLVAKYGEDPGMENNTDGYYFTTGEMVAEFEEASFALKENEISEPVKTSYGYHVILRLPMEEKYLITNFSDLFSDEAFYTDFDTAVSETQSKLNVTYTKLYDQIDVETVE